MMLSLHSPFLSMFVLMVTDPLFIVPVPTVSLPFLIVTVPSGISSPVTLSVTVTFRVTFLPLN